MTLYETQADIDNEIRIIKAAAEKWECTPVRCPTAYHLDAMLLKNGKPRAFAEARKRKCQRDKYPTFIWSLQKYMAAQQFANYLPTVLLVEWSDGIYYRQITQSPLGITWVDRTNTTGRDERDNEPCVEIPTSEFKRL